jgi:hypothetical protein
MFHDTEQWTFKNSAAALPQTQVVARINVPPKYHRRVVWIGADAFAQTSEGDFWAVKGEVRFLRAGQNVGTFFIKRANSALAADLTIQTRLAGPTAFPDVLIYDTASVARIVHSVAIPALAFNVECDEIVLYAESVLANPAASAVAISFVLGLRCLSSLPSL